LRPSCSGGATRVVSMILPGIEIHVGTEIHIEDHGEHLEKFVQVSSR
jgi:hypothetical protein